MRTLGLACFSPKVASCMSYAKGLALQLSIEERVAASSLPDTLIILEVSGPSLSIQFVCFSYIRYSIQHSHVYTMGKRATLHNLLVAEEVRALRCRFVGPAEAKAAGYSSAHHVA